MISVYITHPNQDHANRIVGVLLEENLIACANSWEIQSQYRWEGKMVNEKEIATLCKTTLESWTPLVIRVKELHEYDVPCIEKWDTEASDGFRNWVTQSTKNYSNHSKS